jgi:hypothetical protein
MENTEPSYSSNRKKTRLNSWNENLVHKLVNDFSPLIL